MSGWQFLAYVLDCSGRTARATMLTIPALFFTAIVLGALVLVTYQISPAIAVPLGIGWTGTVVALRRRHRGTRRRHIPR